MILPNKNLANIVANLGMDLNPYKFLAPFDKYEFAHHIIQSKADLVILPMAWRTSQPAVSLTEMAKVPDADTVAYWVQRLQPVIGQGGNFGREVIVVINNRVGTEGDANYAGSSVVLGISKGNVKVYGCLGRGTEDLLIVDIPELFSAKPYGKDSTSNTR